MTMLQHSLTPELPSRENDPTNIQAASSVTSQQNYPVDAPHYGFLKLLMLHSAPGALTALVYLALSALALPLHLPTLLALLLAGGISLVPLEMRHLLLQGKRLNSRWSLEGIVLYRRNWRGWRYLLTASGLCILSTTRQGRERCPRNRFEQRQCRVARGSESRFGDLWGPVGGTPKQIAPKRGSVWYILAVRDAKKEILGTMPGALNTLGRRQ
jgi:hypothetical protein